MSKVQSKGDGSLSATARGYPRGLQDKIYEKVRNLIVTGTYLPGERLRELKLANRFGTSQAPVREALRRLSQEGLTVSLPRRGTFVTKPSLADVEDVYLLRAEVESLALRYCVVRMTDEMIGELYRYLEEMRVAIEAHDYIAGTDADMRFHGAICKGSGSSLLESTWASIDSRVRGLQSIVAPHSALAKRLVETHEPILRALSRRDGQKAEALIRSHLQEAWIELEELVPLFGEHKDL